MLTTERLYEIRSVEGDTTGHVAARSLPVGQLRRATKLARAENTLLQFPAGCSGMHIDLFTG